jgi:pimeloyl-ACP methyl ester carboxylesterase
MDDCCVGAHGAHRYFSAAVILLAGLSLAPASFGQAAVAHPANLAASNPPTLRLGNATMHPCGLGVGRPTWCGTARIRTTLFLPNSNKLNVSFAWVPATNPPPGRLQTVLAAEGGPGYPSTGTAADYAAMLGPTLRTHNLLVVDQRGTGSSALIRCLPLQHLGNLTTTRTFRHDVARCGNQLTTRSDLYSTAYAARDLAAVIRALRVGPVDFYGDSYGTYLGQSLLAQDPHLLRSVTLDSAYEARGLDPWYRTTVTTARRGFNDVCRRSPACRAAAPGQSWHRITRLARRLRHHPITGYPVGLDAHRHLVRINVTNLVNLVNDAGYDVQPYRDLDAAVRAYLDRGDAAPLLRLWAQDIGWDDGNYVAPPSSYSDGDYYAVACTDYPQLFDMHAGRHERVKQLAAAVHRLPAETFAPFTTRQWMSMQPYTEAYTACLNWPRPHHHRLPPTPPGPLDPSKVPVLILNGGLDSLTPAAGGAHIARQIGPAARAVRIPNTVHLVALDNPQPCGRRMVRSFIAHPGLLQTMSVACTRSIPPIHAIGVYPRTVANAQPGRGHGSRLTRQLASVATAAAGDAAVRFHYIDGRHDQGLRGGSISYTRVGGTYNGWLAHLHQVRWTVDTRVTGRVRFPANGSAGRAHLTIALGNQKLRCVIRWSATRHGRWAKVRVAGHRIVVPSP